ncbi:MAG: polysaccharide biosynthesis/export family protein [Gemmatimonadota bacterium]
MADKLGRQRLLAIAFTLMWVGTAGAQNRLDRATATFEGAKHVVQQGDVLRVRIWGWPEPTSVIEGSFPVEADGVAHLPVIGRLEVVGQTAEQVQEEFRRRFAEEQRNPVVTVTPLFAVSVMGEVRNPGVVDVAPGYTVFDAVSLTGGFTDDANRRKVLLVRGGGTREIEGGSAGEAAALLAQTPLESSDRIVVLQSRASGINTLNLVLQGIWYAASLAVLISR